jgi:anti-anti-sigma factor
MQRMTFTVSVHIEGAVATLSLHGRFDLAGFRTFRDSYESVLQQEWISTVEVDLSEVKSLDSSALGMLLVLREAVEQRGRALVLVTGPGLVRRELAVAQFNQIFAIR